MTLQTMLDNNNNNKGILGVVNAECETPFVAAVRYVGQGGCGHVEGP
jgi:hypothetical protein